MIQSVVPAVQQHDLGLSRLARFQGESRQTTEKKESAAPARGLRSGELSPAVQRAVDKLRQIDRAVRAHEQAHLAVGSDLVRGGPSYSYATGPDNKRYAIAGEVSIDTSPGRTPKETIPKAQHIRATAMAPADPSPQDHAVAAEAARMESEAHTALLAEQQEGRQAVAGAVTSGRRDEVSGGGVYGTSGQVAAPVSPLGSVLSLYA